MIFIISFSLAGCYSKSSTNPEEVYKYWLGEKPPKELKIINGSYYQSPHFTLEYEVFLEMEVTKTWWKDFIRINNLSLDNTSSDFLTELPEWFKFNSSYTKYSNKDKYDRSAYFINLKNGKCFIYETLGI
ncbi:hypothetical protein ACFQ1Q_01490 [Winogradskyella litorisediminis]|uniref:Lipoprotein n=1 Tax=Winogradskyella litorisediminis TaxID=1156618 RepID=A0ABW3N2N5_9FLAO